MILKRKNFKFIQNATSILKSNIAIRILRKILSKEVNLFLRTNDIISHNPLINGNYEPHLIELYKYFSKEGHSEFFIDIGANIGLSSCFISKHFDALYLIEPNPLVFKILEVNVAVNKYNEKFTLFNFGLAKNSGIVKLMVPKHNWGGAFIVGRDNSYNQTVLAKKDGFNSINPQNYLQLDVQVNKADESFYQIFHSLNKTSRIKGVIKIDVEGYEDNVLKGLSQSLPNNISVFVVFENWDPRFDLTKVLNRFDGRAQAFMLTVTKPYRKKSSPLVKSLLFLLNFPLGRSNFTYSLKSIESGDNLAGNIVLMIK